MAPLIRKRKRGPGLTDTNVLTVSSSLDFDSQRLQALLRRNFEATFEPLPNSENAATSTFQDETRSTDEGEETAWEGLSDTEEQNVDVVQHLTSRSAKSAVSREELKKFMVRRFHCVLVLKSEFKQHRPRSPQSQTSCPHRWQSGIMLHPNF